MGMSGANFEDSQHPGHDGMNASGMDPIQHQELLNAQNMQLMMLDETMNGPQAVRYDEVYYPRTDKRSISKSLLLLCGFADRSCKIEISQWRSGLIK